MFHRLERLKYPGDYYVENAGLTGLWVEVEFEDDVIKYYNIENLFDKYPQFRALKNRKLFKRGNLKNMGLFGLMN